MARIGGFLPRLVAVTVVWLLLTAALTYAAGQQLQTAPTASPTPTVAAAPTISIVVVPDVRGQAYVFAKGILQDAGFAWKVSGGVAGYATNKVAAQVPGPGTRVVDTGSPTIQLRLARGAYAQEGAPENIAPFSGTELKLATAANTDEKIGAYKNRKPKAAVKHAVVAKASPRAKPAAPKPTAPKRRAPAFRFPGQKPEPQDEVPLPVRARNLATWLAKHPEPTDRNVGYWLYQHAWVVTGAEQGWWHGAEALRLLLQADRRANAVWGIGTRSEAVARMALAEVEARSK